VKTNALEGPDAKRARLRAIMESMDREISHLSRPGAAERRTTMTSSLRGAWTTLVRLLMGPPRR
jgi:hypothetical protein